jgi:hypothetical protein
MDTFVTHAQWKGMTAAPWWVDVRTRLTQLAAAWPEEDSARKQWTRTLLAGNWNDSQHVELVARFLKDHLPVTPAKEPGIAPTSSGESELPKLSATAPSETL